LSRRFIEDLAVTNLEALSLTSLARWNGRLAYLDADDGSYLSLRAVMAHECTFWSTISQNSLAEVHYSLIRREGDPQEAAVVAACLREARSQVDDIDRF